METEKILVCDACLTAACWHGHFYCEDYQIAGLTTKTRDELIKLGLEHPFYWDDECCG